MKNGEKMGRIFIQKSLRNPSKKRLKIDLKNRSNQPQKSLEKSLKNQVKSASKSTWKSGQISLKKVLKKASKIIPNSDKFSTQAGGEKTSNFPKDLGPENGGKNRYYSRAFGICQGVFKKVRKALLS